MSSASWVTLPPGLSTRRLPMVYKAERSVSSISPAMNFPLMNPRSLVVYFDAAHPETMEIA